MTVTEHRIQAGGVFSKNRVRVPLSAALGPPTAAARKFDAVLTDMPRYFTDVSKEIPSEEFSSREVEHAARELEWRGSIHIDNREDDSSRWQVRRVLR